MYKRRVAAILGSRSDFKQAVRGLNELRRANRNGQIDYLGLRICSVHRNPDAADVVIQWLIDNHVDWVVAGAGGSNHLTAILDTRLRNKYHDVHTMVVGVAFSGKKERGTLEAIYSITGVPGFQGVFDEKRHVGSDGFYNACMDAISMEKREIKLAAPKPAEYLNGEEAYLEAINVNIPPKARYTDLIGFMEAEGFFHEYAGKVRHTFSWHKFPDLLYFFQTDRISIFDIVLNARVPFKGAVLTATTVGTLTTTLGAYPNHLVAFGSGINKYLPETLHGVKMLQQQMLVVKKTTPLKIEAICRGYLTGSALKDYQDNNKVVCGIRLPDGLVDGSELYEPIFTPSTKAEMGEHDENISFEKACEIIGQEKAESIRNLALSVYKKVRSELSLCGIIVADTKLEFGEDKDGKLMIIDEAFTPDCSRFWPKEGREEAMREGRTPPSLDKQLVRDAGKAAGIMKGNPQWAPSDELIAQTTENYLKMARIALSKPLERFQKENMMIDIE